LKTAWEGVREIIAAPAALYEEFKKIDLAYMSKVTDTELAEKLKFTDRFSA